MGQKDRDYWYNPREFRGRRKLETQVMGDLFSSESHTAAMKRAGKKRSWHWLEFLIGIAFSLAVVIVYPVQIFTAVQWFLMLMR